MKYIIKESNYEEYIKNNGLKCKDTFATISIKNNEAKYFIVENNNEFITDFIIYNKDNLCTLNPLKVDEKQLPEITKYLKNNGYTYLTFTIYYKFKDQYDIIKNNLNIIEEEKDYSQSLDKEEFFYKLKISL